jgi:DNA modification methylase
MRFIQLSQIKVSSDRQRKEFDHAAGGELMDSIQKIGLLHPITISNGNQLRAGERRFRAIQMLTALGVCIRHAGEPVPLGSIPAIDWGDLDEITQQTIELDENIKRQDITWQEKSAAIAKLDALRKRQDPTHTILETAAEVFNMDTPQQAMGYARERVRRNILLSKHLDDPTVGAAKSLDDAYKILKRKEAYDHRELIGAALPEEMLLAQHQLLKVDSIAWMLAQHRARSVDCIVTDPPYCIDSDTFTDPKTGGTNLLHNYEDTVDFYEAARGFSNVAKDNCALYCFCDVEFFASWKTILRDFGWKVLRTPLVWYHRNGYRVIPNGPRRCYELILAAYKGDKKPLVIAPDIIEAPPDPNLGHAAQKPVAVYQDLIRRNCGPGDRILDPFCGSGTIFPAAHGLKCFATGIENNDAYAAVAQQRLQQLKES